MPSIRVPAELMRTRIASSQSLWTAARSAPSPWHEMPTARILPCSLALVSASIAPAWRRGQASLDTQCKSTTSSTSVCSSRRNRSMSRATARPECELVLVAITTLSRGTLSSACAMCSCEPYWSAVSQKLTPSS